MGSGIRAAVAAITWLIAGLSFAELVKGVVAVGEVGGYCRDGGAILSTVPCPDGAGVRIFLGAIGFAAAVIANIALTSGVGPDLPAFVFPGLFAVIGILFLLGAFAPLRWTWILVGVASFVACGVMLWLNRESGWLRLAIGSRMLDGTPIAHRNRALYHRSVPHPGSGRPTAGQAAALAALGFVPFAAGIAGGVLL